MKKKPIKIGIIGIRSFPSEFPGSSGVEVYIEKILKEFLNSHLSFILYTKKNYPRKPHQFPNIVISAVPTLRSKLFESVSYGFIASLFAMFSENQIIWYQGAGTAMWSWLPRITQKKIVITIHGLEWERKKWNLIERKLFLIIHYMVFLFQKNITVVSSQMNNTLKDSFGIESLTTSAGFDDSPKKLLLSDALKKIGIKPNNFILYVGRLVPEKRVDWLIEAYLKSKKFRPKFLVIVGTHGNMPEYEIFLKRKYDTSTIIWLGFIPNREKNILLSFCQAYILPSEVEGGNPLSFLEALSYKKNCLVATDSVTENFKKISNVYFFQKESFSDFNKQFKKLLQDSLHTKKSRYNPTEKELLKQYSWKKTAAIFSKNFSDL